MSGSMREWELCLSNKTLNTGVQADCTRPAHGREIMNDDSERDRAT